MKKLYFLFLFLLFNSLLSAQSNQSEFTKITYFKNGMKASEKFFDNDKNIDSIKTYHIVGGLKEAFYFDKNQKDNGLCRQFTSEGKLQTLWKFEHGKLLERIDYLKEFNLKNEERVDLKLKIITDANAILKVKPNDINAIMKRAGARYYLGNSILAENDYLHLKMYFEKIKNDANTTDPAKIEQVNKMLTIIYDALGSVYSLLEDENRVIYYYLLAIKTTPTDTRLQYNLGAYLCKIENYRLGIPYLKGVLMSKSTHSFANWTIANCYLQLEQYDLALEHVNVAFDNEDMLYKRGLGTDENDLRTIRGLSYHKLGKTDLGIADLNEALRINNKNSVAYKYLGMIYLDLGQKEKACSYFQKSRALDYEKKYYAKDLSLYMQKACEPSITAKDEQSKIIAQTAAKIQATNESTDYIAPKNLPYIAPNPAENSVEVFNYLYSDFNYIIYDVDSRLVQQGVSSNKTIDVSGLPQGIYILTISKEIENQIFKLIKK